MRLSPQQLADIASWTSIQVGFDRDLQTQARIEAIARHVRSSGVFGCDILHDDGLSNYYALFSYALADVPDYALSRKVDGLLVYLSSLGPIGVIGRYRKCVDPSLRTYQRLSVDQVLAPERLHGPLEIATISAIRTADYELLSPEDVAAPLPAGVEPFDYIESVEPSPRVLHALFSETD